MESSARFVPLVFFFVHLFLPRLLDICIYVSLSAVTRNMDKLVSFA